MMSLTFLANILLLNNSIVNEVLEISKNELGKAYRINHNKGRKC